jgi:hypothetical protein
MQFELSIAGYRPAVAIEISRAMTGSAYRPRSAYCAGTEQKCHQQKAPNRQLSLVSEFWNCDKNLKYFDSAPICQVSRVPRSALESDHCEVSTKR